MKKYGIFLKNERLSHNLSQEKLAKIIGITQAQISYYEKDINEPSISICEKLADFYGISIDELIGRDNIPVSNYNQTIYDNHGIINNGNIKNIKKEG